MTTDLVAYVGGPDGDNRAELRHALRSWDQNYRGKLRDVWVVGDVPAWFTGAKMPLPPADEKFRNARQSITAYVNCPAAADIMILTMDDVVLKHPIDDIPICHLGPVTNYSAYKTGTGTYARAVRETADWITKTTGTEPLAYLAHTPVPLDTAKVRAFLDDYPDHLLLEPFLLYAIAGTAGPGRRTGNAKCARDDNHEHKLGLDIPFVSSNPDSWGSGLGDYIRSAFPSPSRWER